MVDGPRGRSAGLVLAIFATVFIATGRGSAAVTRELENGEACAFPIDFNGKLEHDCVSWNNEEWCQDSTGLWGKCKPSSGGVAMASAKGTGVVINEVLARGSKGQEDFVELFNTGDETVDLTGWTLRDSQKKSDDDDDEEEDKGPFVFGAEGCADSAAIAPGAHLLLTRDEKCSFSFGLGKKKDEVVLSDADGNVVDQISWKKGEALKGISMGRLPNGKGAFQKSEPTPGEANGQVSVEKLKGELPDGADVTDSCCKKIKKMGFSSNLPVIVIDTKCQEVKDEPKIRTELCTCSDELDYADWAGVEIRGSSSARDHKKKGMAVKLWNATGHNQEFSLLGMPKDEDWVLYGPETDRSIGLRNFLAYNISRSMDRYATRTKFVEVFLQDECNLRTRSGELSMKDYHGVYLLEEKIKRHKKRVDICKHNATKDITGGYIFKHDNDNIDNGDVVFPIKKRFDSKDPLPMVMIYPKGTKEELKAETNFLEEYLNGFERALKSKDFADPERGYEKFIEVDTFIDNFLAVEITKNPDSYRGSTYMRKDCGKKVEMGPMWDYNEAFGMCCGYPIVGYMNAGESGPGTSGGSAISENGWRFNICEDPGRCVRDPQDGISHWFVRLWEDPAYRKKVADRWQELRKGPLSNDQVNANFDEAMTELRPAAIRNYNRWKEEIGSAHFRSTKDQWEHEAKKLRDWTIGRMEWMDTELAKQQFYTHSRG